MYTNAVKFQAKKTHSSKEDAYCFIFTKVIITKVDSHKLQG